MKKSSYFMIIAGLAAVSPALNGAEVLAVPAPKVQRTAGFLPLPASRYDGLRELRFTLDAPDRASLDRFTNEAASSPAAPPISGGATALPALPITVSTEFSNRENETPRATVDDDLKALRVALGEPPISDEDIIRGAIEGNQVAIGQLRHIVATRPRPTLLGEVRELCRTWSLITGVVGLVLVIRNLIPGVEPREMPTLFGYFFPNSTLSLPW